MENTDFIKKWILPHFEINNLENIEFGDEGGEEDADWLIVKINSKPFVLGTNSMGGFQSTNINDIREDCGMVRDKPPVKPNTLVKVKKQFRHADYDFICRLSESELHHIVQEELGQAVYNSMLTRHKQFKTSTYPYSNDFVLFASEF